MIIYKTTNLINGKIYIGKTKRNDPNYYGSGIVISHAINKYGKENFKRETIDDADTYKELNEKEVYWIKYYNSTNKEIGYNRSLGGDGFSGILPETIEKIRSKNLGQKRTLETKLKMSKSAKGKVKAKEHKEALSEAWKKRRIEKPTKKETLEKMSKSMMGKHKGKYVKIYEFEDPDGNRHITSEGIVKFCKKIKKHPFIFKELIEGKREHYSNWKYIRTIKN